MDIYTILISKNTNLSTVKLVFLEIIFNYKLRYKKEYNLGIKKDMKIKKSNVYITK